MAGKPKGEEPLTDMLQIRVTETTAKRLDSLAISQSKPGAMKKRSDVAREAIDAGLDALEAKERLAPIVGQERVITVRTEGPVRFEPSPRKRRK